MKFFRELIASCDVYDYCKTKFPNRNVIAEAHCPKDTFYYFNKKGNVRQVNTKYGLILVCDYARGPFYMKPIRRVDAFKKVLEK